MNQEQQLQAIQQRWLRWRGGDSGHVDTSAQTARAMPYAVADVTALLRMVEERNAIIHDLQLDGAESHERIRLAERCEVVNCLRYLLQRKRRQKKAVDLYDIETQIIGCRGLVGNLLPPDQARAECERLRAKLRAVVEQIDKNSEAIENLGLMYRSVDECLQGLKQLASEDTP